MDEREKRLIRRAQEGDGAAFEALVHQHDRQVLKLARHMLNNLEDAQDVYQEIFIKVFHSLPSFRFESAFSTWLYRLAINQCINFRQRRSRRRLLSFDVHGNDEEKYPACLPQDKNPDPEAETLNQELGREIALALETLSDKQRAVFVLRHFHGRKLQDIAKTLGCAEGTVKNYLFRATQRMQEKLREYRQA
ncbi:MAG: RNA polymerase sigma factor [candidate division KSB1 bacterium]|nr:RNA polymerase sigma factor [candidate division KSB1 bacterium]MDZ7303786.1 RNA polymerase sigma factor [candidate division KSB1 bacterium]MDZ7313045.1 RNA polymerase sigma factor [candidate division KSB1 bacterium]